MFRTMPRITTLIIGIFVVGGASFLFASRSSELPAGPVSGPAAETDMPSLPELPAPLESDEEPLTLPEVPETVEPIPELPPVSAPAPKAAPPSLSQLQGLWKSNRQIVTNTATGQVVREDGNLFYTSFKGDKKCYYVELVGSDLSCTGGYDRFTIDAQGRIIEDMGVQIFKFSNGSLEAVYTMGPNTERHIYTKESSQPVAEIAGY